MSALLKAVTETGSFYLIDTEFRRWAKNSEFVQSSIWSMKTLPVEPWVGDWEEAWKALKERPEVKVPVVGERLFVSGKDAWYLSTEIVALEEVFATRT